MPANNLKFSLPLKRFDKSSYISRRVDEAREEIRRAVRCALAYLYLSDGPKNIRRPIIRDAWPHLDPAERIALRWLQTRTNGSLRSTYGHAAAAEARAARFRCRDCGQFDVRTLQLDHVDGRGSKRFRCLCANCHQIKSRLHNW